MDISATALSTKYLPSTDVVIDVGGRASDVIVRRTARDRNTVRTYDNFSPLSNGTMNVRMTSIDVTITGMTTFKL